MRCGKMEKREMWEGTFTLIIIAQSTSLIHNSAGPLVRRYIFYYEWQMRGNFETKDKIILVSPKSVLVWVAELCKIYP